MSALRPWLRRERARGYAEWAKKPRWKRSERWVESLGAWVQCNVLDVREPRADEEAIGMSEDKRGAMPARAIERTSITEVIGTTEVEVGGQKVIVNPADWIVRDWPDGRRTLYVHPANADLARKWMGLADGPS